MPTTRKCLFVSQRINDATGGARVVSRTNLSVLRAVLGEENVIVHEIRKTKRGKARRVIGKIFGYLDGLTSKDLHTIKKILIEMEIDTIYVDSSYFGKVVRCVKVTRPHVRVAVFYHDILAHWWAQTGTRNILSFRYNAIVLRFSESLCAQYADMSLVMTERDRDLLIDTYGTTRDTIHVTPLCIALHDISLIGEIHAEKTSYNLFVGVDYKPNIEGLEWFLDKVQPSVAIPLFIIGKGMDKYKLRFEKDNVRVIGLVDDLAPWYRGAKACIIPLFSGSGMKVKTGEAFFWGKTVLSTDEGLTGYRVDGIKGVYRCNTPEEFIQAIAKINMETGLASFNDEVRELYERDHSTEAAIKRIREILA